MDKNLSYFKLKETIDNPLRIFFLCGSFFDDFNQEKLDKRIVLKKYIESMNSSYKCLILEEHFMFRNFKDKLNYNDINMRSLKSIEVLTSFMSDRVIVFHESISTAAEIGLFSSDKTVSEKLIILAPDTYSTEEDVITGFMKLAYNNGFFPEYNLEIIRYYPGRYFYEVSSDFIKPHTYFVDNALGADLQSRLINTLSMGKKELVIEKSNIFNMNNNKISKYRITGKQIEVVLNLEHLVILLTSLFTVDDIRVALRTPISNSNGGRMEKRKRVLFKVISVLKQKLFEFIHRSVISEEPSLKSEKISIEVLYKDINISSAVSYFIYVMYGIKMIDINSANTKLIITNEFNSILTRYEGLIVAPTDGGLAEVLNP
ncbi:hypothetical protein J0835_01530 [Bacillus cereus group sp. Sample62]|uniref:hypothetical protein n=1 Tax=Bacillus cereus group TaxID=86661 RepID=UPI00086D5245|nr:MULTISPECIES: hypothetical protein [Bacillus cereus group]SCN29634.1 Uncharacterized protein BC067498_00264 [Bacillus cereus]HDR4727486.1 hypothetical protein [Bacillus cereus]HDX9552630.1 hypothetical protein [Bacillus thuringiensis]